MGGAAGAPRKLAGPLQGASWGPGAGKGRLPELGKGRRLRDKRQQDHQDMAITAPPLGYLPGPDSPPSHPAFPISRNGAAIHPPHGFSRSLGHHT